MIEKIENEIKSSYYMTNYSNDGQRFVAWYLRNIHNLDEDETKYAVTDGTDDKCVDGVYIDDDASVIHIIQGKFYRNSTTNAEPLREVLSSWLQLKNLVKMQEGANTKLKQRLFDISNALDEDYDIEFELLISSELTKSAQDDLRIFQEQIGTTEEFTASLSIVDEEELARRYELALGQEKLDIEHIFSLEPGKYMNMKIANVNAVIAAIPLKECIKIPHIKDGALFRKNVRQSLGLNNQVNKGIKDTIYNNLDKFFFYHNGITAICSTMKLDGNNLTLKGLSVVNGCQSLNTILSCSEKVKEDNDSYIMFRFYEVPDRDTGDKISTSTNSQSAVKARDLRSNDKRVLAMKKAYEQKYSQGYLITKRGEIPPASKNAQYVIDLELLGKYLITWQSQRPNIAYSPTKIFDKYFDQLFKKDYDPENIYALSVLGNCVLSKWVKENPLGMHENLFAMKAYAPYHHLYAVSLFFATCNAISGEFMIDPKLALQKLEDAKMLDYVVTMAGNCLNMAFINASAERQAANKMFTSQNWVKSSQSLRDIRSAVSSTISTMKLIPSNKDAYLQLAQALKCNREDFLPRWTAD